MLYNQIQQEHANFECIIRLEVVAEMMHRNPKDLVLRKAEGAVISVLNYLIPSNAS